MIALRFAGTCLAIFLFAIGPAWAEGSFSVAPNARTMNFAGGESQSTVVPPGLKKQCTSGRILISNDGERADVVQVTGLIHYHDLVAPKSEGLSIVDAIPNAGPNSEYYWTLTNDHDIVALPNGDVIYETGAATRRPLNPSPDWFNYAYRNNFGPGARSTVLVWRSTDCGQTFQFESEIDTAGPGHEDCAFPQGAGKSRGIQKKFVDESKPPTLVYDMGGSDGQWMGFDRESGKLVLMVQCVGKIPIANSHPFRLSEDYVSKTYIFTSANEGASWEPSESLIPAAWWRPNALSVGGNRIVAQVGANVRLGTKSSSGNGWNFGPWVLVQFGLPGYDIGSNRFKTMPPWNQLTVWEKNPAGILKFNIPNWWSVARVPGSHQVLLLAPEVLNVAGPAGPSGPNGKPKLDQQPAGTQTFGSGLYFYDPDGGNVKQTAAISPVHATPNSFIMHVTAIDPGAGPVLLYWCDIDGDQKRASIRGRFLFGLDQFSEDFDIFRVNGTGSSFSLLPTADPTATYWYGDYKTAAGFGVEGRRGVLPQKPAKSLPPVKYRYFPVWVQPDSKMHYTEVTLSFDGSAGGNVSDKIAGLDLAPSKHLPWRQATQRSKIAVIPWAKDLEEGHEYVRGPERLTAPVRKVAPQMMPPAPEPPDSTGQMTPDDDAQPDQAAPPMAPAPVRPMPVAPRVQTSTLCRFTSGPRSGQTQDYAPMAPLAVGSYCQDARGSTGVVVAR
jgi:hypothetical protein